MMIPETLSAERGRPLSISVSDIRRLPKKKMTAEDFHKIQSDLHLSKNQTKTLGKHIRSAFGTRKVKEPFIRETLQLKAHELDSYFLYEIRDFDVVSSTKWPTASVVPVIYCCDVSTLTDHIASHGNFPENNFESIIGIDSGGGFLKICLTVRLSSSSSDHRDSMTPTRSKLSEGVAPKSLKDTSVSKWFILAIVPEAQESYRNVLILWNLLKFTTPEILPPYTFCMDLKLANIVVGLMSHSCLHPCTWCDSRKDNLFCQGNLRTLGSIRAQYWQFVESERGSAKAKDYGNCVHAPMFKYSDNTRVLDILPPPELHLMLGTVNFLYSNLEKKWPEVIEWPSSLNIEKEAMHGGTFAGNGCRKLLSHIDKLERIVPDEHKDFVAAFRSFNDVVVGCFGQCLRDDYKDRISTFRENFEVLRLRPTPKIHSIFFHVSEFCDLKQSGLGTWSEQAFESVHSDFDKHWKRYKVPQSHERFNDRLLRTVQEYNSSHL